MCRRRIGCGSSKIVPWLSSREFEGLRPAQGNLVREVAQDLSSRGGSSFILKGGPVATPSATIRIPPRDHESARTRADSSFSPWEKRLRPLRSEISSQGSSWMEALASSRGLLFHLRREGLATLSERLFVGPCREHESARVRADSSFSSWEKESRPPRSEI